MYYALRRDGTFSRGYQPIDILESVLIIDSFPPIYIELLPRMVIESSGLFRSDRDPHTLRGFVVFETFHYDSDENLGMYPKDQFVIYLSLIEAYRMSSSTDSMMTTTVKEFGVSKLDIERNDIDDGRVWQPRI